MEVAKLLALFAEGLLSFFSPCVLPILPVYVGILGGQSLTDSPDSPTSHRRQTLVNVLCFTLGIALTFFVLGFASSVISRNLLRQAHLLRLLGGGLVLLMGLIQLGVLSLPALNREFSLKQRVYRAGQQVTPFLAVLMGFAFSFSWSPCIGPILASVFLYASSHQGLESLVLIGVYCLGFVLPFVLVAFFSQQLLTYFKAHYHWLAYTKVLSGLLLLVIGIAILSGGFTWFAQLFS